MASLPAPQFTCVSPSLSLSALPPCSKDGEPDTQGGGGEKKNKKQRGHSSHGERKFARRTPQSISSQRFGRRAAERSAPHRLLLYPFPIPAEIVGRASERRGGEGGGKEEAMDVLKKERKKRLQVNKAELRSMRRLVWIKSSGGERRLLERPN